MFWTHGGAFKHGSGNTNLYGPEYLIEKDVIVVTVNYRLGPLGFLCLDTPEVPGNAGLKDIVLALNWVKENIDSFGGDADNVTVFGESAGGAIASALTASPASKHLISKAIVQSGTALFDSAFQKSSLENALALAEKLGFEGNKLNDNELLEFFNSTPAQDIIEAAESLTSPLSPNLFTMVVEKEFLGVEAFITEPFVASLTSGRIARIPIMVGSTTLEFPFVKSPNLQDYIPQILKIKKDSDEAKSIAEDLKKLYFEGDDDILNHHKLTSDISINIDTHRYVQYLKDSINTPIYSYKFDYVGELNISSKSDYLNPEGLKAPIHLDDLGYLFRNYFEKDTQISENDFIMRERMVRLWTNFAKTGNPTPDESHFIPVTWQPVTKDTDYYLSLGPELTMGTNYDEEKMAYWDDLYNKHYKIWDQHRLTNEIVEPKIIEEETRIINVQETIDATEIESQSDVVQIDEPKIVEEEPKIVEEVKIIPDEVDDVKIVDSVTEQVENGQGTIQDETSNDVQTLVNNFKSLDTEVHVNGNGVDKPKPRTSNEIKMVISNGAPKDVIRANDPPEDDLPKNIGVNKFVNFFESLGGKK